MARIGNSTLSLSGVAGGPITANRFVGYDDNQVSVQGGKIKGVAEYGASAAGQSFAVTAKGTAFVETGGVFNPGDPIISDNVGRAIAGSPLTIAAGATAVTSTAANGAILAGGATPDYGAGNALGASTAAGQFVEILLR